MKKDGINVLIFFSAIFLLIAGLRIMITGEMPVGTRSGYTNIGNISYVFGSIFISFSLKLFYELFYKKKT